MLSNISHVIYAVLSPILSTCFIILNILTADIFWRRMRLTSLSLLVMVNICVCDIFVCLFSNTFYVLNIVHARYAWSTGSIPCKLFRFLTMLMNIAQIYLLCILVADRYRRIVVSVRVQWNKKKGIGFATGCWIAATVITIPRLFLFDELEFKDMANSNETIIVNVACKPIGMNTEMYAFITISTFVLAYALPCLFILYTLFRSQLLVCRHAQLQKTIQEQLTASTRMHQQLALTFNLTGSLFLAIWTPFFIMSLLDLTDAILWNKSLIHVNFTLRCTLLVIGSAKPLIYIACLEKFRNQMKLVFILRKSASEDNKASNTISTHTESTPAGNHSQ